VTQVHTPCSDGQSVSCHCPQCLPVRSLHSVILNTMFSELWILVTFCHGLQSLISTGHFVAGLNNADRAASSVGKQQRCRPLYSEQTSDNKSTV